MQTNLYVIETSGGLEHVTVSELQDLQLKTLEILRVSSGEIQINYAGSNARLLSLQTATAVNLALDFKVPRPKALLGHEHFTRIVSVLDEVINQSTESFQTIHIAAAGNTSSVMRRLLNEFASATELEPNLSQGDLNIRIRPSINVDGWQVLVRLTPRPLSVRSWRLSNYEGAINAAVANAILRSTLSPGQTRILNVACGSGTFLIELFRMGHHTDCLIGIDNTAYAIESAIENTRSVNTSTLQLLTADMRDLPFMGHCFDYIIADLPFGNLTGSHEENIYLYPMVLDEVARVSVPTASFAIVTHEIKLMNSIIDHSPWAIKSELKIDLSGLHPRLYVLKKRATS